MTKAIKIKGVKAHNALLWEQKEKDWFTDLLMGEGI